MAAESSAGGGRNVVSELAFLTRVLKAPSRSAAVEGLSPSALGPGAGPTRISSRPAFNARSAPAGPTGARAASAPADSPCAKSWEDVDVEHQRALKRETLAHLGTLDFIANKDNVVFLGPPGTGKTHLAHELGIRACHAGHRTLFATAVEMGRTPRR